MIVLSLVKLPNEKLCRVYREVAIFLSSCSERQRRESRKFQLTKETGKSVRFTSIIFTQIHFTDLDICQVCRISPWYLHLHKIGANKSQRSRVTHNLVNSVVETCAAGVLYKGLCDCGDQRESEFCSRGILSAWIRAARPPGRPCAYLNDELETKNSNVSPQNFLSPSICDWTVKEGIYKSVPDPSWGEMSSSPSSSLLLLLALVASSGIDQGMNSILPAECFNRVWDIIIRERDTGVGTPM